MSDEHSRSRFLQKWKLVRAAARDNKRLSAGDVSVLIALCDRYGSKFDPDAPAMAGHALLGAMSGLSRRATIDSTRRLADAGYISVLELGSGTRGTRYGLNFARGEDNFTATTDIPSGEPDFTTVVNHSAPLDPPSGEADFTESPPTLSRLQASLHVVGSMFDATAAPPPADGLEATAAETASGDGFDEFWKVWPRKHGLKKARAEWAKIITDVDIIIDVAGDWAAHYKGHDTDQKWIPEPANWLRDERWLEDLPLIHGDSKGAAIAKAKANAVPKLAAAPSAAIEAEPKPDFTPYPNRYINAVIDRVDLERSEDDNTLMLTAWFRTPDGIEVDHLIIIESPDHDEQERGQKSLKTLLAAVGLAKVDDSDELVGLQAEIEITHGNQFVTCQAPWVPAPKVARNVPKFMDVNNNTPWGGWATKIGTSIDDDDEHKQAA